MISMERLTERLILREFVPEDWAQVLAYQSDPRYLRFYAWTTRTPKEVQTFVQMFVAQQREAPRSKFQLAVTLKDTHDLIGNCGVRLTDTSLGGGDTREAEIGYEFAPDFWGKGYATEATQAMAAFAFDTLKIHRLSAHCIAENTASARVLEKLGMKREGRLREKEHFKGRYWDTLLYAILESEWRAQNGPE